MTAHRRPRFRFSSKIVVASVSAVIFYTCFIFFLELLNVKYGTNIQIPSELTAAWYAFWTVELVCLASIRKTKIKNKYEYDDPDRQMSSIDLAERYRAYKEAVKSGVPVPESIRTDSRTSGLDRLPDPLDGDGTGD